tara:strand:+ start:4207 stop:4491 length:285 start_codon:yes stop_codon:yes gene_type:complete
MGFVRSMGAGLAGSSRYNVNVNLNTHGGSKKQGLPASRNIGNSFALNVIKRRASSKSKALFIINQLGGVGRKRSPFLSNADGVRNKKKLRMKYN